MNPPRIQVIPCAPTKKVNGAAKIKKYPGTDSLDSNVYKNTADENSSWWYAFFVKCHSDEDEKPSWEPEFWQRFCPHPFFPSYRQFSRIISLGLIGCFAWCTLYTLVGNTAAPPNGKLFQLILLSICAHFGGWLMSLTTLPRLVGMLFTGLVLQNSGIINIDESFTEIINDLSHAALVVILIRAGLDLDPPALHRLKYTVIKLSLIPWVTEAATIAVLSKYFLDIPWDYAILLGTIVAAVAPAVVLPCLFRLRSKGYGVAKGIPTLIIAVASIGDSTSVAIFGVIKSIMFSDMSVTSVIIQGPISIFGGRSPTPHLKNSQTLLTGIGFGILWGLICGYVPERNDPFITPLRILLLLAGGMVAVFTSEIIGYGGAGPLGCVSAAFVALSSWSKQGWDVEDNPAATAFEIFWMICQPILFGIAGARIKLNELNYNVVSISLGILVTGVVIRILVTTLVGIGCKLNLKEKIFVAIAWMCKAIVQAALGPVALTMVAPDSPEYVYAEKLLTTCVLSIILTVPTGALLTTLLGTRLLTKAKHANSIPEIKRRKGRRPSMRDISIADEDNVSEEETSPKSTYHLGDELSVVNE
ncbi:hypothetical protein NQ315_003391 [Exocentrus adspersus]|uniref:Cation/H+ exchanger transmembrane domain-containing protein n=1 Tax=Exocentrus adspersus TaxID=1586481 RepID=A0AAV8VNP6_9CUCU|nr:hypothetical protein NQ315_003391 [Exocentrus adspersus]